MFARSLRIGLWEPRLWRAHWPLSRGFGISQKGFPQIFAHRKGHIVVLESMIGSEDIDMQTRSIGRPPKFSTGERFRVKESAPAFCSEQVGTVVAQGPGKAEYTVRLDDGPNTLTYLQSNWMEPVDCRKTAAP